MNTLEGSGQDCLTYEANGVREQAELLETEAREAEHEARASVHEVAQEIAGLYDVLITAGALVAVAKESLSRTAVQKSEVRFQLKRAIENAAEVVNNMSELIRKTLATGHTEQSPEKDQKSSK